MEKRFSPLPAGAGEPHNGHPSGDQPTNGLHPAWCARDNCEPGRGGVALHTGESQVLADDDFPNRFHARIRTSLMHYTNDRDGEHRTYVNVWAWDGEDGEDHPHGPEHFEGHLTLGAARRLRDRLTELLEVAEAGGVRLDPADPDELLIAVAHRVLQESVRGAAEDVLRAARLVGVSPA